MALDVGGDTALAEAPAPVADIAPPDAPKTEAPADNAEAAENAWHDDLRKVFRNAQRVRDDSGKFVAKDGKPAEANAAEPPEASEVAAEPVEKPVAPAVPAVEVPRTWQGFADKFAALPPDVQKLVVEREGELQEVRTTAGRLVQEYTPIRDTLAKHADYLNRLGQPLQQYLDNVIATSRQLDSGNAAAVIQQLAKAYNVDLFEIADPLAPKADPNVAALQAEVQQLRAHLEEQQRHASEWQRQQQEAQRNQVVSVVDEFLSKTPDAAGHEAELEIQISAIRRAAPNLAPKDMLSKAWENVVWANEKLRAARLDADRKAQAEAAQKAARQAQQAASVNVRGAPRSANSEDMDADLRAVWRKNHR